VTNGSLVSSKLYYDTGEVQQSTDPCLYKTTYQYNSASPYYGVYLTKVTNQLSQSTSYGYDSNTGAVTSITDPNSQPTYKQYDILTRPTQVTYPDNGSTSYCYTDMGGSTCTQAGAPYKVVITKAITTSPVLNETSTVVFDGLGRLSQTQLNSDSPTTSYTQTTYDALGRKYQVYNPTRCNPPTAPTLLSSWGLFATTLRLEER
jgi:YD repeat-containing protein